MAKNISIYQKYSLVFKEIFNSEKFNHLHVMNLRMIEKNVNEIKNNVQLYFPITPDIIFAVGVHS